MNYPDEQERADREGRDCEDCGTRMHPGTDHGDEECIRALRDRVEALEYRLRSVLRQSGEYRRWWRYSDTALVEERTWAARLEGALETHDCALLGDMRRKYRGDTNAAQGQAAQGEDLHRYMRPGQSSTESYHTSAAALAEPNE